jgi:hypothetical protein
MKVFAQTDKKISKTGRKNNKEINQIQPFNTVLYFWKQNKMASYRCKFLRCNEHLQWVEHIQYCTVEISKGGNFSLIVRDAETGSLIADFPRASIRNVESLSTVVLRIYSHQATRVALKFEEERSLTTVFKDLKENEVICSDVMSPSNTEIGGMNDIMPDLVKNTVSDTDNIFLLQYVIVLDR